MSEWLPGELFHQQQQPIFCGDISRAHLYKQAAEMAHVCYAPAHANPQCSGLIIPDTVLGGKVATVTRGVQ